MPRLNETQRAALGYWWNLVTDAAQAGFSTTETVQIAAGIAKDAGGTISFTESQAIASLYGYAKRMDNTSSAFQNAAPYAVITPDMVATPPWARDEIEQRGYPLYNVKFYYNYIDQAGNEQTGIRTSVQPMQLPGTKDALNEAIQADAEAYAAKYMHQLIAAIPFQILAV